MYSNSTDLVPLIREREEKKKKNVTKRLREQKKCVRYTHAVAPPAALLKLLKFKDKLS